MNGTAARRKLLTTPSDFLKYYPVKCAGTDAPIPNAANLCQYHINKLGANNALLPGEVLGHYGAIRIGFFGHQHQISSFKLEPQAVGVGAAVINEAHVVPMVNYNSDLYGCPNLHGVINGMPHYVLDGTGDGLMVTGELSGCCFCWIQHGNDLWCIHVQPAEGINGADLHTALAHTGRFAAAPDVALSTFGRNDYPGARASVIGVRKNGRWKLYAQTSTDSFHTLTGAFKIHPGGMRAL